MDNPHKSFKNGLVYKGRFSPSYSTADMERHIKFLLHKIKPRKKEILNECKIKTLK